MSESRGLKIYDAAGGWKGVLNGVVQNCYVPRIICKRGLTIQLVDLVLAEGGEQIKAYISINDIPEQVSNRCFG